MRPEDYPVTHSVPGYARKAGALVEFRVGRFTATAASDQIVTEFRDLVLCSAHAAINDPLRLVIMPHLCNAIAQKMPNMSNATRALIEGFVCDLVSRRDLLRLGTISKQSTSYHAIYSAQSGEVLEAALTRLRKRLHDEGRIALDEAKNIVGPRISHRLQNVMVLLGNLVYLGEATMHSGEPTKTMAIILPHA